MAVRKHLFVLAVDGGEASLNRLKTVLTDFARHGDEVHLAHVLPEAKEALTIGLAGSIDSSIAGGGYDGEESTHDRQEKAITDAKKLLIEQFVPILKDANVTYEVALLLTPSKTRAIGEVLVNYATNVKATALVLGKSDRTALQELFLGSVFKAVLHASTTSVIVVR